MAAEHDPTPARSGRTFSWASTGLREVWSTNPPDVFTRSASDHDNEEEALKWAALEKLPTYDRMRRGILKTVLDNGKVEYEEVQLSRLGMQERRILTESILEIVEEDNEMFLRRLRDRIDRVGIELPKIEVRFEHLSVQTDAYVGSRALPTLLNATMNMIEEIIGLIGISSAKQVVNKILTDVSGILEPSRMTLLLGPPGSGKTTLLKALSGELHKNMQVKGKITHCGRELWEFVPQRTCAYISQHDLHNGELSVRETLDFSRRCQGVGTRRDMLTELSRREKDAGIKPDPLIDAFMKAITLEGQETNLVTDYVLKLLGLDICADVLVGDEMRRGISGGQKKRVTTGEMLVGPAKALFMDEISTGLDSSTTFEIIKCMGQIVHVMDGTVIITLLQPPPETFNLFDNLILLSEGQIVYQGPREEALGFFESMGFRCPERKGVADFLQEVTSNKNQEQYWFDKSKPYRYIPVSEFAHCFTTSYPAGIRLNDQLRTPYDKSQAHPAALAMDKYGITSWELFKACLNREWLLARRNSFVYIFKIVQITFMATITMTVFLRTEMDHRTIADAGKYYGALFFGVVNVMFNGMIELSMTVMKLPVFYKQRDFLFYPPWAFVLPIWILRIPLSFMDSTIWIAFTYYVIGFAPGFTRFLRQYLAYFCLHQMALSLFRFIAAVGRSMVVANMLGMLVLLVVFVFGGFVIAKDDIQAWWAWAYWASPMMYGQNAVAVNEFLDDRWGTPNTDPKIDAPTIGTALLKSRNLFVEERWYWISIAALLGFSLVYNVCFLAALKYLNPFENPVPIFANKDNDIAEPHKAKPRHTNTEAGQYSTTVTDGDVDDQPSSHRGMILPFQPLSLAFDRINYYVDMPTEMKSRGYGESRLQLLRDVSGAFRPGALTALMGVSGAGKSTLMDVLAGRKTGGYIEGSISVSGYPKKQSAFARVSGYCEQSDIHSPNVTVHESLIFSAWLRLPSDVNSHTRKMFVEEVMQLVELAPLRDAIVGLPGVDGLSTEQRKRLTIAVELVANPSIIFMDEPTSGLDARAAAIVMRTVRNAVDTGRTVVCTIHQPSIDIFEVFDELLLMKRGGQAIYAGPLCRHSHMLVEYFEAIPGVPKIRDGYNPATWMLEITTPSMEAHLGVDFADIYSKTSLYRRSEELIKQLSTATPGSQELYFPSKDYQNFWNQYKACFWKQYLSYWRNPSYNAVRFFFTIIIGIIFGTIFWNSAQKTKKQQDLLNLMGAIYAAIFYVGCSNASNVMPVVSIERSIFYRERAAGMYSALPYALAQVCVEIVYVAVQALTYVLIIFPMMNFTWRADKFFCFYFFMFMCLLYFTLYGMMLVALTPSHHVGAICRTFFLIFWNLFSGFLIPRPGIPIWWRWYYWANPAAWSIYGVVVSQMGENHDIIEIPGDSNMPANFFLKHYFGYEHTFLRAAVGAHFGFVLIFLVVFACGIKFINFQKR